MTDQEKAKTEDLISRLEISVGQIFPRDGGNASLLASMIQTLNGLRSVLGLVRTKQAKAVPSRARPSLTRYGDLHGATTDDRTTTSDVLPTELNTARIGQGPTA